MNNKKITIIFIVISFTILITIGITFAYFTSSTDFENEFTTGLFQTEATETFTSPQNWLPGDTTPKELTITNTGNVDVKARVCLEENWESDNGDTLPLEQNGNRVAIINLANTSDWTYRLGCYEYNDVLEPNDTTSSFIQSVTFNPNIETDITCITNGNTKTCTSSGDGYDNATYTLTLRVETIQANAYETLWPNPIQYVNRKNEGQITTGDEIAIDTEHFYVITPDDGEGNTVLLSKYNLLVGDTYEQIESTWAKTKTMNSSNTEGYGLQSEAAKGYNIPDSTHVIGVVAFSGKGYWDNSECVSNGSGGNACHGTGGLKSEYANASNAEGAAYYTSPYPYVYRSSIGNTIAPQYTYASPWGYAQDNGYTISYFVEEYVNVLKTLGAPETISGRLLSYEEANNLIGIKGNWSYWLGSANTTYRVFSVRAGSIGSDSFWRDNDRGVRPVIEIPTSEIP